MTPSLSASPSVPSLEGKEWGLGHEGSDTEDGKITRNSVPVDETVDGGRENPGLPTLP